MPPLTIATLEALARINRQQWEADKAALRADMKALSQEMDTLTSRSVQNLSRSGNTSAGRPTTPLADNNSQAVQAAQQYSQASDQAAQATVRLTAAQRAQQDPILAQARLIRQTQSDLRAYTLAAGDADPRTQALSHRLDELKAGAQNAAQGTNGLSGALGSLIDRFVNGQDASTRFTRGLAANLGGFSLLAGGAVAAGAAVATLLAGIGNFVSQGISLNAQMEQFTTQFTVVLGSATVAQQRIQELTKFAEVTPFDLPQVVEADRVLQTFGGTLLATGKNLTLTGDIAAGTGRDFSDVALWVGRAYDALQNGRPWGEAALRLQEMGALSGNARQHIEDLQASGASGQQVWAAFTQEMARFNGLMEVQSHTVSGLASNFRDELGQSLRTATAPAFEAVRQQLEGLTSPAMQANLQHTAENVAKLFDAIGSGGSAIGSTAQALGNLPLISQTLSSIGTLLSVEGKGFDTFGTALHDLGIAWGSILGTSKQADASTQAQTQHIETYSQAVLDADRSVGSLGVVWLDTAGKVESAGQRISQSMQTDVLSGLTNLKQNLDSALPDVPTSIQTLLTTTDDALNRARDRADNFGSVTSDIQLALSKQLEDGLGVLQQWAQGNLDACSAAAAEWGATGPEIITHIQAVRDQLQKAVDDANRAELAFERAQAQMSATVSAHAATERASTYGTQPLDYQQQLQDIQRQQLAGQIVDTIQQTRAQTALSTAQANNAVYLQAQLDSERAQSAAQAALDRVKLSDQSFLQGQASQQITGTQLQTAIARVKLNNSALMDASIQADAAQMEVQTAIARVRGTNSILLAAQVDSETASTQATTALERAKAGSAAYNQAQVAAEKAQRDAQDALDTARVKAGLIDPTQTAAYQRARQQMITPVELAKQQLEDVYSIVKTGLDTATTLSNLYIPAGAITKMGQVTDFEDQLFQAQQKVADKFSRENIIKLYDFGQAAAQGIAYFSSGVDALSGVAKLEIAPPDKTGIDAALANIDYIFEAIDKEAQKHGPEETAKAGIFAQTGQSIAAMLSSWASAFTSLQPQRFDLRGQINLAFENIDHSLSDLAVYSASWKNKASDSQRQISDNVGAILKSLNDALSPFANIQQAGMVGDYEIDLAIDNVEHALTKMGDLADSPVLQGQSLTRLQQASSTLGSVFSGLKTALDTLTGLTSMADSTGNIDVGYSLDQFFLTQVPTYADTWEKAMLRIGNASEGVAGRVKGAFGTPSTQNAMAGAGTAGSGNGNTYVLNIDASKDPVIDDLIKKIFDRVNLKQGGVLVGVGG